jgi:hypothetical protein
MTPDETARAEALGTCETCGTALGFLMPEPDENGDQVPELFCPGCGDG